MLKFSATSVSSPSCLHMLWLLLCSLLLMADSLSAVPHHQTVTGLNGFQANFHCSRNFVLYEAHCYRYFGAESKRPFYHAEKQCAHFSSTLVSLLSHNEEEFVVQLAANNTAFWIGLNDDEGPGASHTEGVFKWTSSLREVNSELQYLNWKTGEPNNRKHLDCVKADVSGWAMATGGCASSKLPFVCKKKACPQGLDWDGKSCDILINRSSEELSHSDWSVSLTRHRTMILIFLASLVVILVSLVAKASKTATRSSSTKDSLTGNDRTMNKSFSRVEDLLPPS